MNCSRFVMPCFFTGFVVLAAAIQGIDGSMNILAGYGIGFLAIEWVEAYNE